MNEMLRSLGFGQVNANKWANGSTMVILVNGDCLNCIGGVSELAYVDYVIEKGDQETMKHHVEKFMSMVGKCIQVDEE